MKRIGYLYERMEDKDFIRSCYHKAIKGKRNRWDIRKLDEDKCVEEMYRLVTTHSYVPAQPRIKKIFDQSSQKERQIRIVPFFPDGLMQQMLVEAMKPALMRNMYPWSCASIPGRGGAWAERRTKRLLRNKKKSRYCLKLDIRHYYPSVPHEKLIAALRRKIKDEAFLKVVISILETCPEGLAIGFYLSQWLSNFYLESLDWFIAGLDGVYGSVRYMDDIVVLGSSKRKLHRAEKEIERFCAEELGLTVKKNWQVFPVDARGIDFVGLRFFHGRTGVRRRNFLRLIRQCRRVLKRQLTGKRVSLRAASGLLSRASVFKHTATHKAREKYYDKIDKKQLKEVIRFESYKLRNATRLYA